MAQCTAKSKRTAQQCRQPAILRGTVCKMHGGSAPQIRAAAQARLLAMVDPALGKLAKLIQSKADPVALGAVKDILDRAGLKAIERVEIDANVVVSDDSKRRIADKLAALAAARGHREGGAGDAE